MSQKRGNIGIQKCECPNILSKLEEHKNLIGIFLKIGKYRGPNNNIGITGTIGRVGTLYSSLLNTPSPKQLNLQEPCLSQFKF